MLQQQQHNSLQTYLVTHSVFSWGTLQQQQHNSLQTYLVTHSVFSWGTLQQQQHNSLQTYLVTHSVFSWGMLQQQQHNSLQTYLVTHSVFSWGTLQQQQHNSLQTYLVTPVCLAEERYNNNNITRSAPSSHSYESANMSGTPHFFNISFWILNTKQSHYNSLEQVIISSQNLGETPLTARTAYYSPPTPPPPPQPLGQTQLLLPYCTFPIRGFPSELFMKIPSFIPKS